MNVGVIGAGAISGIYLDNMIHKFDNLTVLAVAASHLENAQKRAAEYGIRACTVDELLSDEKIEMVVVLTPVGTHYELIKAALQAGKHVYTEKTITDDVEKARELSALAKEKGLYLGSAPDTFLGAALQTARKAIDEGLLGEATSFSVSANRDNNVLLSLFSFLRQPGAGITLDYVVYYMTALVYLLGPVEETAAFVRTPFLQHKNIIETDPLYGQMMDTPNESEVSAIIKMKNGICGTLHINADSVMEDQAHMIIYGTGGMLYLTDPNQFGGEVRFLPAGGDFRKKPSFSVLTLANSYAGNERGIGPADMARAIREHSAHRANDEMAVHVLEVLSGILKSGKDGQFHRMSTTCSRPEPLRTILE